jgi:hypothetical protein
LGSAQALYSSVIDVLNLSTYIRGSALALYNLVLDVDQVENLIKFCPTEEEMDILNVVLKLTLP